MDGIDDPGDGEAGEISCFDDFVEVGGVGTIDFDAIEASVLDHFKPIGHRCSGSGCHFKIDSLFELALFLGSFIGPEERREDRTSDRCSRGLEK